MGVFIYFLFGGILGVGLLFGKQMYNSIKTKYNELHQQNQQTVDNLNHLQSLYQEEKQDNIRLDSQLDNLNKRLEELKEQSKTDKEQLDKQTQIYAELKSEYGASQQEVKGLNKQINEMEHHLVERFKNMSHDILEDIAKKSKESFSQLTKTELQSHRIQQDTKLDSIMKPLQQQMTSLISKEATLDTRIDSCNQQMSQVMDTTKALSDALKHQPTTRGHWGEFQLERILQIAGMTEHINYTLQPTFSVDQKNYRPDVLIHLPNRRCLVVDSKMIYNSYKEYVESTQSAAEDQNKTQEYLNRYIQDLRRTIDQLASKDYWAVIQAHDKYTPDFVVMFLPCESSYQLALKTDKDIFQYGFSKKVVITGPLTLLPMMKTAAYISEQVRLHENSKQIIQIAKQFYERLGIFVDVYSDVGDQLNKLISKYNKSVGSYQRRLKPSITRLEEHGIKLSEKEMSDPALVNQTARPLFESERLSASNNQLQNGSEVE